MWVLGRALLCASAIAIGSTAAQADIVFETGASGTGNNVVFNVTNPPPGNTILGTLNGQPTVQVLFTGLEQLFVPSGGQARIEASDGGFTQLTTEMVSGDVFYGLVINLDVVNGLGDAGTVTFFVTEGNGQINQKTFSLDDNGNNFFTIRAINAQDIDSVKLVTTVNLLSAEQIRLEPVPVPVVGAGIPALLAACGGLVMLARRRRKARALS